jgi:hypothetical protein
LSLLIATLIGVCLCAASNEAALAKTASIRRDVAGHEQTQHGDWAPIPG